MHCVGDGASWLADQADRVFGKQGSFLIDFFHLCDYLSCTSAVCPSDSPHDFFAGHKKPAEEGRLTELIGQMEHHTEPASVPDEKAPVRRCIRYITNRPNRFNYKKAAENGLPVGSGEIESAHRYIIQKRLKIAGAWWKENNAQKLPLRVLRANGDWDAYWENIRRD